MSELRECPFCGGTEAYVERYDSSSCFVVCDSVVGNVCCIARGPIGLQESDDEEMPGRDAAIAAWNRRASPVQAEPVSNPTSAKNAPVHFDISDDRFQEIFDASLSRHDKSVLDVQRFKALLLAELSSSAHPPSGKDAEDHPDTKRLDFLTQFGSAWFVQYRKDHKKPIKYRMVDDGEAFGKWHNTAREAIDAAMSAEGSRG